MSKVGYGCSSMLDQHIMQLHNRGTKFATYLAT